MGTPHQSFRALLGIDFNGVCLFSSQCPTLYCDGYSKYDHEASTSFTRPPGDQIFDSVFPEWWTSGPAAKDVMKIDQLQIDDQEFEEATEVRAGLEVPWEGIVGLSRFNFTTTITNFTGANPFHNMISRSLLSRNVFSLLLPSVQGDVGVLTLGPDNAYGPSLPAVTLPLTSQDSEDDQAHEFLGSGWQTGLHSLRLDAWDGHEVIEAPLDGYTVVFSTVNPLLTFPSNLVNVLKRALHVSVDAPIVDCEKRSMMPNMTLRMGVGSQTHDIVLTPEDYTSRSSIVFPEEYCSLPWNGNGISDKHKLLVLGTPFLRRYHTTFDYDNETVTCKWWIR